EFLRMAVAVVRHHHERFNGTGYPDGLSGADIPLAARMTALADVYDALRCWRPFRPGLSHAVSVARMLAMGPSHFDPTLLQVSHGGTTEFERVSGEFPEGCRRSPSCPRTEPHERDPPPPPPARPARRAGPGGTGSPTLPRRRPRQPRHRRRRQRRLAA